MTQTAAHVLTQDLSRERQRGDITYIIYRRVYLFV